MFNLRLINPWSLLSPLFERCWRQDWCINLDIKAFFDTLDHELMMKAIRFHTDEKWIHPYVERWLMRFSKTGELNIETAYSTSYMLIRAEKKRESSDSRGLFMGQNDEKKPIN